MVIDDPTSQRAEPRPTRVQSLPSGTQNLFDYHSTSLASPQDRLAAVLTDHLILMPLIGLVLSPLKRLMWAQQAVGGDWLYRVELLLTFATCLFAIFVYQTLCVYYWQATPGKLLLGLRVRSLWGGKPSLRQCAERSVVWQLEVFCLLLPFLAILRRPLRRAPHDRLSDTLVTAPRWRAVGEPTVLEHLLARNLFFSLLSALFCFATTRLYLRALERSHVSSAQEEEADCLDHLSLFNSTQTVQGPKAQAKSYEAELLNKLSLFTIGSIESECLAKPADRLLAVAPSNATAYLAKAFFHSEDQPLADEYLSEVCLAQPSTSVCSLAKILRRERDSGRAQSTENIYALASRGPDFLRLWGAKELFAKRQFRQVLSLLEQAPLQPEFANFVIRLRLRSLWLMGERPMAMAVFETHLPHAGLEEKLLTASWLCKEQLKSDCGAKEERACQIASRLDRELAISSGESEAAVVQAWREQNNNCLQSLRRPASEEEQ